MDRILGDMHEDGIGILMELFLLVFGTFFNRIFLF